MLATLLLTVIILVISLILLSVKILFKKNGQFPNTHVSGNKALMDKGITCAQSQHAEQVVRKNLYDRLKEI
ncbi:hypothetical protein [Massilibacteroides sp.]|uniref:hypothetical protein n=1 Tax=Massilibacteroides sp. TaxID=2034766 RepID=UPI00262F155F|nr:hypothetical protein [Massilibacteroides sp.]MDD4515951.1 hypothetical protein [Massilibacteroides sp.]